MNQIEICEEWRQVVGFEGYYQVSNLGRIRRLLKHRNSKGTFESQRFLRPFKTVFGYQMFTLSKNCWRKTVQAQRLVAEAFIGPCSPGKQVDHIDGNPGNNNVLNLRYVTPQENMQAARNLRGEWRKVPFGEEHPSSRLSTSQIIEIRRLRLEGMKYADIAKEFGVSRHHVSDIVRGKVRSKG